MNPLNPSSSAAAREVAELRFARGIIARLDQQSDALDGDIAARLRFGRERAIHHASEARSAAAGAPRVGVTANGAALLGGGTGWWLKVASVLPLLALLCGLVLIQHWQATAQISVAAEVDAALLADDLPPTAYRDPGFVEFLKLPPLQ